MRQLAGQAALALGRWLHGALTVVMAIVLIGTVAAGGLAWRLSQRPLDITWLVRRIEQASVPTDDGVHVDIRSAALAWEGWRLGLDHPLDIRVAGVTAARPGRPPIAQIPEAEISLSFGWLLRWSHRAAGHRHRRRPCCGSSATPPAPPRSTSAARKAALRRRARPTRSTPC